MTEKEKLDAFRKASGEFVVESTRALAEMVGLFAAQLTSAREALDKTAQELEEKNKNGE